MCVCWTIVLLACHIRAVSQRQLAMVREQNLYPEFREGTRNAAALAGLILH